MLHNEYIMINPLIKYNVLVPVYVKLSLVMTRVIGKLLFKPYFYFRFFFY